MYLFIFSFGPSSVFYAIIISTVGSVFSRSLLPPSPLGLISYSTMRRESRLWWRSRGIFVTIRVHASATNGSSEQKVSQESITTTTPPPPSSSTTATTADATIFTKSQRDKRNKKKKNRRIYCTDSEYRVYVVIFSLFRCFSDSMDVKVTER